MFANFIYFIVALLIVATYTPPDTPQLAPAQAAAAFIGLAVAFAALAHGQFRRLRRRIEPGDFAGLDQGHTQVTTRLKMMAVALFALDIYGLNLPAFIIDHRLPAAVPTLSAVLFLALFAGYLCIVWSAGYDIYRRLYAPTITRRTYVVSNLAFAAPMLLPWLLLSLVGDLINALPFEGLKAALATPQGQVAYFLLFLVAISLLAPPVIQRFWRCQPLPAGPFRSRIEALCQRAGVGVADILRWPVFGGRMITAGVMGLVARFRYILVTDALLQHLSVNEIDAVVAHEIGHVKRRHLLFYLLFFVGYMLISYTAFDLIVFAVLYSTPVNALLGHGGLDPATLTSTVFSITAIALFLVYFRFIFGYYMRNFERQADTYVYNLLGSGAALITTLQKIALTSAQPADKPNWHHFSIRQRIDYLMRCEGDRSWIRRHDRKVRRSIGIYLAFLIAVGLAGYQLNFGEAGRRINSHFFEKIIQRELARTPDNPRLLTTLGDVLYSRGALAETEAAYRRSLSIDPDQPQALNNLAWLYATCEDQRFRNPPAALQLATDAARLDPRAHILDTLAEAYWVNGMRTQALETGRRALAAAGSDRGYFEKQVEKFAGIPNIP